MVASPSRRPGRPRAPLSSSVLVRMLARIHRLPALGVLLIGLVLIQLLAVLDYTSGAVYSFNIFYVLVVITVSASGRMRFAVVAAVAAAVVWGVVDGLRVQGPVASLAWNGFARFGVFYLCALLVSTISEMARLGHEMSRTDSLTGLLNQRGFRELAERELARMKRRHAPCTLLYLDIDGFKKVNDSLGHAAGDVLLAEVAHTMSVGSRGVDVVGRLGGDEFAVLMPDTDEASAHRAADRLSGALGALRIGDGWPVRFSIGVVTFLEPPSTVNELLSEPDRLMYDAKRAGKSSECSTVITGVVGPLPAPR